LGPFIKPEPTCIMRVDYSITRMDLFRAQARVFLKNRILWLVALPLFGFTWWSTFSWPEIRNQPSVVKFVTASLSTLICASVGAAGGCLFLALQTALRRDKGVLGCHSLELTEEGLVESTDVNRSLMKWGGTFRIRETRRYVYIYVSDTSFYLVPRARVAPGGPLEPFLAELRGKIDAVQGASKNGGPPTSPTLGGATAGWPPSS
jgi:hypothetical protein